MIQSMQEVVDHILSIIINSGRDEATTNCSVGALTSKEILHHYGTSNMAYMYWLQTNKRIVWLVEYYPTYWLLLIVLLYWVQIDHQPQTNI